MIGNLHIALVGFKLIFLHWVTAIVVVAPGMRTRAEYNIHLSDIDGSYCAAWCAMKLN